LLNFRDRTQRRTDRGAIQLLNLNNLFETHKQKLSFTFQQSSIKHTFHSRFIFEGVAETTQYSPEMPTFYQNKSAMNNTADVTGKPNAV
jgi:hypothetical protein